MKYLTALAAIGFLLTTAAYAAEPKGLPLRRLIPRKRKPSRTASVPPATAWMVTALSQPIRVSPVSIPNTSISSCSTSNPVSARMRL